MNHNTRDTNAMQRIESKLLQHGSSNQRDNWQCPAHTDRNPSLTLYRARDYKGAFPHCQAGCTLQSVLDALGLDVKDLYDERYEPKTNAVRETITRLRERMPYIQWHSRTALRDRAAYSIYLDLAWAACTLDVDLSCRRLAEMTIGSKATANRAQRKLCALGLIRPRGAAAQGDAKTWTVLTTQQTDLIVEVSEDGVVGKDETHTKVTKTRTLPRVTSSMCLTNPHLEGTELGQCLTNHGLAVVSALTVYPQSRNMVAKRAGVDPKTAGKWLREAARWELAVLTDDGWVAGLPLAEMAAEFVPGDGERHRVAEKKVLHARQRAEYLKNRCAVCKAKVPDGWVFCERDDCAKAHFESKYPACVVCGVKLDHDDGPNTTGLCSYECAVAYDERVKV
jgi:hypothetical protein